jgi:hypothetical protein
VCTDTSTDNTDYRNQLTSALPPKADIVQHGGNVRFGP